MSLLGCSDDAETKPDAAVDQQVTEGGGEAPIKPDLPPPDSSEATKPTITQIIPPNGFSGSTTPVVLVGKNFVQGMTVYFDGQPYEIPPQVNSDVSAKLTIPKNPNNVDQPYKIGVRVIVNQQSSNEVYFQYTITIPMADTFKGAITMVSLQSFRDFESDPVEGKALAPAGSTVKAEVGLGPVGGKPGEDSGWIWAAATPGAKEGDYQLFSGKVVAAQTGDFDLAYRFSTDGGQRWIYADSDETDLAYDPAKAAKLKVEVAPVGYCQAAKDCALNAYAVVCKVDPQDKKKNTCVECLSDADCTGYEKALGPKCDTSQLMCGCTQDDQCQSNPNGAKCFGYCGCEGDTNCVAPTKCTEDPKNQVNVCK